MSNIIQEIQSKVAALPDHKNATIRALRQDYTRQFQDKSPEFMLDLANQLLTLDEWDFIMLAYELVHYHRPALESLTLPELQKLGVRLNAWERVDVYATHLAGVAWRIGNISDEVVLAWAQSPDRWWRRTALVCTIALNNRARGGTGDTQRTLLICEKLIADRDDMVVKAMSWALRALSFWDDEAVWSFLESHEDKLASWVKREVKTKLETGLKNPRRD